MDFNLKRFPGFVRALRARSVSPLFLILLSVTIPGRVSASDGITLLPTGSGGPLLTESLPFFVDDLGQPVQILVDFGFGTDEPFGPGTIFDSLTLWMGEASGSSAWVIANIDAGGLVVEPATPGTLPFAEGAVSISPIPPQLASEDFANLFSFSTAVTVPDALIGSDAILYFDLFDNQNGDDSAGWFSNFSVVPEAATSSFVLTGLLIIVLLGRIKPRFFRE